MSWFIPRNHQHFVCSTHKNVQLAGGEGAFLISSLSLRLLGLLLRSIYEQDKDYCSGVIRRRRTDINRTRCNFRKGRRGCRARPSIERRTSFGHHDIQSHDSRGLRQSVDIRWRWDLLRVYAVTSQRAQGATRGDNCCVRGVGAWSPDDSEYWRLALS